MNTTRRYYRTAGEAFKDASYANAFDFPPLPLWRRILKHILETLK